MIFTCMLMVLATITPVAALQAKIYPPSFSASPQMAHGTILKYESDLFDAILNIDDENIQLKALESVMSLDGNNDSNFTSTISTTFPETDILSRNQPPSKSSTAISFSGGGARSYVASIGIVQALRDLGLWDKIMYSGGISGGNWFLNAYSYRSSKIDTTQFLGTIARPEELTLDFLGKMDSKCMRSFVNVDADRAFLKGLTKALVETDVDDWNNEIIPNTYASTIYDTYFKKGGIKRSAPFAWDEQHASEIISRNSEQQWKIRDFNLVGDAVSDPFPLIGFSLLGPLISTPAKVLDRQWRLVEQSPIAIGIPNFQKIDFENRHSDVTSMDVGGFVESVFFGTDLIERDSSDDTIATVDDSNRNLWTLERGAAASSAAPMGFVALLDEKINKFGGFKADYFSTVASQEISSELKNNTILLGDGGSVEDVTLIPFLQRGVKSIILAMSFEIPLSSASKYNPMERLPTANDLEVLPSWFGIPQLPNDVESWIDFIGQDFMRNQVFSRSDYFRVIKGLQEAQATGNGAVATFNLKTVANIDWGIKGGDEVSVTIMYMSRAVNFENALPNETKALVKPANGSDEPTDLVQDGPFSGFPHYSTGLSSISFEPSNLLADFYGWTIKANEEIFRNAITK